jgi:hypothetical protein
MCVAFMPMHLVVLECKKVSKMRLGAVQNLSRIFRNFLEFILIFSEHFYLLEGSKIFFLSTKFFIWIIHVLIYL